jgi:hypothetical protein
VFPGVAMVTPILGQPDVFRGRSFLTLDDVEFYALALGQALESLHLDPGMVDEDIFRPVLRSNESVTLRIVEPLYFTVCHTAHFSYATRAMFEGKGAPGFSPHIEKSRAVSEQDCTAVLSIGEITNEGHEAPIVVEL